MCRGGVQDKTYSDEVAGIAVLFGGEVVEVSHVLILGRETQRRATFHLLPGSQGRDNVFTKPSVWAVTQTGSLRCVGEAGWDHMGILLCPHCFR